MKKKIRRGGVLLIVLTMLLAGCSRQSLKTPEYGSAVKSTERTAVPEMAYAGAADEDVLEEEYDAGMADNAFVAAETMAAADAADGPEDVGGGRTEEKTTSQKIVWSGYLEIESTDYEQTKKELQQLFDRYQVLVESSGEYDSGNRWSSSAGVYTQRTMSWQIRIPSEHFSRFFEETGNLTGQIRSKSTSSSDLTKKYSDTANRIESLTIQQSNLMEMMKKADTVEDMLAIEDRLTEVRSELRILTNQNSQIDYDVDSSTIHIELEEVHIYETKNLSFMERLQQTILDSASGFVQAMADLGVLLIYAFPYLVVFGALAAGLIRLIRRRRGRKAGRKEETDRE